MSTWVIYALLCPITREVEYIGITSGTLRDRLKAHLRGKDHNPEKAQWIAWLRLQGLVPVIESIDTIYGTRAQAEQCERYWVYEYIRRGYNLLNINHIPGDREAFFLFLRSYQGPTNIYLSQEVDASISA